MNLLNVIQDIEKVDPDFQDRISPRRAAIKNITSFGTKVAAAAAPMAFATLFKKAYGQTNRSVTDVLNYALTLEYLESFFYNQGLAQANLIPSVARPYFTTVQTHETQHVNFLKSVLGNAAIAMPNFDLTAKGTFADVLTNYTTYLRVALAFEDTGVRAYKGQAGFLLGNQVVLTAALQIHSVEARHAAAIRQLISGPTSAGGLGLTGLKSWISSPSTTLGNDTGVAAVNANYGAGASGFPSEANTTQGGVDVTTLPSVGGTTTKFSAAVEAYDEPLDNATVVSIITPFFR